MRRGFRGRAPRRRGSEQRSASEGNAFPSNFRPTKPIFDIFYIDFVIIEVKIFDLDLEHGTRKRKSFMVEIFDLKTAKIFEIRKF